jgi:hypothetical protein
MGILYYSVGNVTVGKLAQLMFVMVIGVKKEECFYL